MHDYMYNMQHLLMKVNKMYHTQTRMMTHKWRILTPPHTHIISLLLARALSLSLSLSLSLTHTHTHTDSNDNSPANSQLVDYCLSILPVESESESERESER
jgi:hypothetical protein